MKKSKNLVWIINQFTNTPEMPGHTRHYELSKFLQSNHWQISLYASDFNLSKRTFLKNSSKLKFSFSEFIFGVKFIWLKVFPYTSNDWKRYLNVISFAVHIFIRLLLDNIVANIRGFKPDIILASSPQLLAAFSSFLVAKIFRRIFILEIRDLWPQVLIDLGGKSPKSLLIRALSKIEFILYRHSDGIVILSKGVESYVRKRGAKKIIWLPNGPDLNLFKSKKLPFENGFSEKRKFNIVYAGAHGLANDLINVVKAAEILQNDNINFIFIGDGPEKNNLIKKSKNCKNIKFKKPFSKSKMPTELSKADAIILSLADIPLFEYGVSPNKLYDAYALGRPVITTVNGLINQEVLSNNIGVISEPANPLSLANAIKRLQNTPRKERIKMGLRARYLAEKIYSRERVNLLYEKFLRDFLL